MSIQFRSKTDLDIPSKPLIQSNPSSSKKASEKLEKIRGQIVQSAGVVAQLPLGEAPQVLRMINEYTGADKDQEAEISKSLFSTFPDLQSGLKHISTNMVASEQRESFEALGQDFIRSLVTKIGVLPFMHDSRVELSLNEEQQQVTRTTLLETLDEFLRKNVEKFPEEEREEVRKFRDTLQEMLKKSKIEPYINALDERHSQKPTVLKKDRLYFIDSIRDIIATQKKFAVELPPISYKEGDSQGVAFAIKKDGQIRGYLQGTMHYLDFIGAEKLANISPQMQKRLYECTILGTERVMKPKKDEDTTFNSPTSSVERAIETCASARGIVNLGIDDEDRDYLYHDLINGKPSGVSNTSGASNNSLTPVLVQAFQTGDVELMKSTLMVRDSLAPPSKIDIELMSRRNEVMADNIDQMLKACHAVGEERLESTPKGFFAVGYEHLLPSRTVPDSVVQLLQKKGWTVELIPSTQS